MPKQTYTIENKPDNLRDTILEAITDKKAERIALISLTKVEGAPVGMMVVCEGRTPTQVAAIADNAKDETSKKLRIHPNATDGRAGTTWIASDYGEIILHVMTPDTRSRYALEELWSDAQIIWIED